MTLTELMNISLLKTHSYTVKANASVCIDNQYHYCSNNDTDYLEKKKVRITFAVGQSEGQSKDFSMLIALCYINGDEASFILCDDNKHEGCKCTS